MSVLESGCVCFHLPPFGISFLSSLSLAFRASIPDSKASTMYTIAILTTSCEIKGNIGRLIKQAHRCHYPEQNEEYSCCLTGS